MKAFYPQISYTIFIVISIVVLSAIMITINIFTDSIQTNYAHSQLSYVAEVIRNDILRLYSTDSEGKFQTSIPKDIVGKQYTLELDQKTLKLSLSISDRKIEVYRLVNVSASLSGKSYAPVSIELNKTEEGVFIRLVQ